MIKVTGNPFLRESHVKSGNIMVPYGNFVGNRWTIAEASYCGYHDCQAPTGETELINGRKGIDFHSDCDDFREIDKLTDFLQWIEAAKESREIRNEILMAGAPKALKPRRL